MKVHCQLVEAPCKNGILENLAGTFTSKHTICGTMKAGWPWPQDIEPCWDESVVERNDTTTCCTIYFTVAFFTTPGFHVILHVKHLDDFLFVVLVPRGYDEVHHLGNARFQTGILKTTVPLVSNHNKSYFGWSRMSTGAFLEMIAIFVHTLDTNKLGNWVNPDKERWKKKRRKVSRWR